MYCCLSLSFINCALGLQCKIGISHKYNNEGLANAKRPCDCSVLCLHLKSSLCSCPHCILFITSMSTTLYSVHVVYQVSSNALVAVDESADLARIKQLKLTTTDENSKSQFDLGLTLTDLNGCELDLDSFEMTVT